MVERESFNENASNAILFVFQIPLRHLPIWRSQPKLLLCGNILPEMLINPFVICVGTKSSLAKQALREWDIIWSSATILLIERFWSIHPLYLEEKRINWWKCPKTSVVLQPPILFVFQISLIHTPKEGAKWKLLLCGIILSGTMSYPLVIFVAKKSNLTKHAIRDTITRVTIW